MENIKTFKKYQTESRKTAMYGDKLEYLFLGICGESGELAEKYKKIIRDKNSIVSTKDIEDFKKELGDVLWYISQLSSHFGLKLEDVAKSNLEKLFSRMKRGKIKGSGDNR